MAGVRLGQETQAVKGLVPDLAAFQRESVGDISYDELHHTLTKYMGTRGVRLEWYRSDGKQYLKAIPRNMKEAKEDIWPFVMALSTLDTYMKLYYPQARVVSGDQKLLQWMYVRIYELYDLVKLLKK